MHTKLLNGQLSYHMYNTYLSSLATVCQPLPQVHPFSPNESVHGYLIIVFQLSFWYIASCLYHDWQETCALHLSHSKHNIKFETEVGTSSGSPFPRVMICIRQIISPP